MEWIGLILVLLFLSSIIMFFIGLVNPRIALKITKWVKEENYSRKTVIKNYIAIIFILFILIIIAVAITPTKTESIKTSLTPTQVASINASSTIAILPTIHPTETQNTKEASQSATEDCSKYMGTDWYSECNQLNYMQEMNREPKLNITVSHNNLYLFVKNNESTRLDPCNAYIGSSSDTNSYATDDFYVLSNRTYQIPWSQFTLVDGTRFHIYDREPQEIEILCKVNSKEHRYFGAP